MSEPPAQTSAWSVWHAVGVAALVGLAVLVAGNAWADIWDFAWHQEESSHVLLVPVAVVWLAWVRRGRFGRCRPTGQGLGTAVLAVGWFFWSYGYRFQVQSFWHGGAILMAVGALLTVLGREVFLRFLPVFGVLVFLVPVPATGRQLIALPLERTTAAVTQRVAEVLGMAVDRQGNLLSVNGTDVAVVEACNGMRMVFTLLFACYVFAFVTPLRGYVRATILVLSPLVAVACNVVRLVPTAWMFGHVSAGAAEAFHTAAGWGMLVVAFGGLVGCVRVLRWASLPVVRPTAGPTATAGASRGLA